MPLLEPLDIVNAACAEIGEAPLESLEDESDPGQSAALLYDSVLEFNLGIHPFSFARELNALSRITDGISQLGYAYVFGMPGQRIGNPIYVTDDATQPDRRFSLYEIVGAQVHSDAEALWGNFLVRAAPAVWSGPFKALMITSLAASFAIPMCHDRALAEDKRREAYGTPMENFRGGKMRAAISADGFTTPPRRQDRDNNPLTAAWQS